MLFRSIVYAREGRVWDMTVCCELFLEVYGVFAREGAADPREIRDILYWYVSDYCEEMVERRVRELVDPSCSFAERIIMEADLASPDYLYDFGEWVTESERQAAAFLSSLDRMRSSGWPGRTRKGTGSDLSIPIKTSPRRRL